MKHIKSYKLFSNIAFRQSRKASSELRELSSSAASELKLSDINLNSVEEGKLANIAAGIGLAASSLLGGKDAIAQDKFKDKIENLGDKLAGLKAGAGEKLSQIKAGAGEELANLKQAVVSSTSLKGKDELKNIGSTNYSFDEIKREFEEESKKGYIQYGVGQSRDQSFSWEKAYADAADRYVKKNGLSEFRDSPNRGSIKQYTFQNKDGAYVTIALFRFAKK